MLKPLTVWITTNWKILKEIRMPVHLTCLVWNLYADKETTVRIRHGTTGCFQVGKGMWQSSILSPGLYSICGVHVCVLHFRCLQLCASLWIIACQTPLFMGFSRQEYWSGLPCPPPADLPNPGIQPRSPVLQVDSLLPEPPEKSMNAGVGSLSLPQGIFLTQKLNWGLLHCRQILYQLSYQEACIYIYIKSDIHSLDI